MGFNFDETFCSPIAPFTVLIVGLRAVFTNFLVNSCEGSFVVCSAIFDNLSL